MMGLCPLQDKVSGEQSCSPGCPRRPAAPPLPPAPVDAAAVLLRGRAAARAGPGAGDAAGSSSSASLRLSRRRERGGEGRHIITEIIAEEYQKGFVCRVFSESHNKRT